MVTFQVSYGDLTAIVSTDAAPHPDLLDELGRRCVRLFAEKTASLEDAPPEE